MRIPRPSSLLLTGASSGIGAALARAYAAPNVHLALTGRDGARLAAVAEECRRAGAAVLAETVDSTDRGAIGHLIRRADAAAPLDLVVANAGISAGTGGQGETEAQARRIFAVNLDGVLNTVHPAIQAMRPRRRGQVALMSSLAGFRGFAGAPAYSASKAAVRIYGEALRGALAADGIAVSVICPGFVESRMTAVNRFPMPLLMPAERAAGIIMRGLAANRGRIAFPWPTYAVAWLLGTLPPGLTDALIAALPRKGSA
ncbi:MAG: SDR family NAD(P)-dependent oxidoreductase [Alphaproteobacteria bacterium]|nr:SDR family NAD(P)-dependent oxidoreductase [Alphaproteobacteria bacterium]